MRTKTKRVYAGQYLGHAMRFTSTLKRDELGQQHITLGGCAPAVQEALGGLPDSSAAFIAALKATVAFCDDIVLSCP